MPDLIRLLTAPGDHPNVVRFIAAFAAPAPDQVSICAPASLDTGDGQVLDLGLLCANSYNLARAAPG
ncbi:MAG: hypothetical protein HZY76_13955 [Anaerolineae bacterium]|nr:MAG: hypothetical protein HZY76_13955 [Anaerolineae bacterium]